MIIQETEVITEAMQEKLDMVQQVVFISNIVLLIIGVLFIIVMITQIVDRPKYWFANVMSKIGGMLSVIGIPFLLVNVFSTYTSMGFIIIGCAIFIVIMLRWLCLEEDQSGTMYGNGVFNLKNSLEIWKDQQEDRNDRINSLTKKYKNQIQ